MNQPLPTQDALFRAAPIKPGDRVLLVETRRGRLSAALAEQAARSGELVGVDFSLAGLQRAEARLAAAESKNMIFFQLPRPAIPYPDGYFDAVLGLGDFDRLPWKEAVVPEIHRLLRPNGRLFWHDVDMPSRPWLARALRLLLPPGRGESPAARRLACLLGHVSGLFTVQFSQAWSPSTGEQGFLLVGRKRA